MKSSFKFLWKIKIGIQHFFQNIEIKKKQRKMRKKIKKKRNGDQELLILKS